MTQAFNVVITQAFNVIKTQAFNVVITQAFNVVKTQAFNVVITQAFNVVKTQAFNVVMTQAKSESYNACFHSKDCMSKGKQSRLKDCFKNLNVDLCLGVINALLMFTCNFIS